MTTLAKAIVEAPSLDRLRLRALAYEILSTYECDPRKAVGPFLEAARRDRALFIEMIGYVAARDRAIAYLDGAAADMRHETEGEEAQDGRAHSSGERHGIDRSPSLAPIPLPKRGAAELGAIKSAAPRSAFDSIHLRDQRPIGDLQWSAIDRFIRDDEHEAKLLRWLKAGYAPADPNALIRDVVPLGEFERMVALAAENN